jgi:hypothetical protein
MEEGETRVDNGPTDYLDFTRKFNGFMLLQLTTSTLVALILSHPYIHGSNFAVGAAAASLAMAGICVVLVGLIAKLGDGITRFIVLRMFLLAINLVLISVGLWRYGADDYLACVLVYGGAVFIDAQWLFFETTPTFAEMNKFNAFLLKKICCKK